MSALVELAPRHKFGLALATPVMLAAGVAGYGDALAPGVDPAALGALVTAPVTRRPVRRQIPRLHELPAGLLWQRGNWNPGLRVVLRDFAPLWRKVAFPVIVHLGADEPAEIAALGGALDGLPGVAGLELDAPVGDLRQASAMVWAAREAADLPILVRVALDVCDDLLHALLETPMDALVVGRPPAGAVGIPQSDTLVHGSVHGPLLAPLVAERLARLAEWVDVPLVGCGGVHSPEDAHAQLAAGALAVQLDTAVWVDPDLPGRGDAAQAF